MEAEPAVAGVACCRKTPEAAAAVEVGASGTGIGAAPTGGAWKGCRADENRTPAEHWN